MTYTPDDLLKIAEQFEKLASRCNCENSECSHKAGDCKNEAGSRKAMYVGALCDHCAKRMPEKYMLKKDAAEKKLDPKAKVRNRGTVCVSAESAKDKKDHFPINDEGQARSALSRVEGLTSAPWYSGSLDGLRALVKKKVHAKYPGIGKDKKKKACEVSEELLNKYAQTTTPAWIPPAPGDSRPGILSDLGPTPVAPKPGTAEDTPEARQAWNLEMQRREKILNDYQRKREESDDIDKKYWSTDPKDAQKTKAHPEKHLDKTIDVLKPKS